MESDTADEEGLLYVELAAQARRTRAPQGSFFLVQPELQGRAGTGHQGRSPGGCRGKEPPSTPMSEDKETGEGESHN